MRHEGEHWVGTWTTSPAPIEGRALSNQTLRMIARVSCGGSRLRVRLSNAYGKSKLTVGSATIAVRDRGSGVAVESIRPLTFNAADSAAIRAGALLLSDPVDLPVEPLSDLAISVYLPGELPDGFQLTGHGSAHQTSYISPPGDHAAALQMPVQETTESYLVVSGVEVMIPAATPGIVILGDSLTDGNLSTLDTNNRWPDELARRLVARHGVNAPGVMNQGIGGNRILHDGRGDSGLRRFDRDVLAQPGVTHVVVLLGINDIRNRSQTIEETVTAEQMIAGLHQLAMRGRVAGLKVIGGTMLTFEYETFNPGFYSLEGDAKRQAVNAWIRSSDAFHAIIDFEAALRDPGHPTAMLPQYDCGDHLHPNDRGYRRMGEIVDLSLFD